MVTNTNNFQTSQETFKQSVFSIEGWCRAITIHYTLFINVCNI